MPLFVIHFLPTGTARIEGGTTLLFRLPQMLRPKSTMGDRCYTILGYSSQIQQPTGATSYWAIGATSYWSIAHRYYSLQGLHHTGL